MALKVIITPVGQLQTNSYLLIDEDTNKAVLVDPGAEASKLLKLVSQNQCEVEKILLTHGHYDHFLAASTCGRKLKAPVLIHRDEEEYLLNTKLSLIHQFMNGTDTLKADELVEENQTIKVGNAILKVIKVPGHTNASVCYYCEKEGFVIAGDTLFRTSIGRTDWYEGPSTDLAMNIKEKLLNLPDSVVVYPGHGPATTVGYEKQYNPYF